MEFSKHTKGVRPILLDTSTIIDGRIADVCEAGMFDAPLIVPRFVLQELQAIADSGDRLKRNRGRRGLDVLNQLQRSEKVDVDIIEPRFVRKESGEDVDQKLVSMALELDGRIITSDFNLAKVAQLRGGGDQPERRGQCRSSPRCCRGRRWWSRWSRWGRSPARGSATSRTARWW